MKKLFSYSIFMVAVNLSAAFAQIPGLLIATCNLKSIKQEGPFSATNSPYLVLTSVCPGMKNPFVEKRTLAPVSSRAELSTLVGKSANYTFDLRSGTGSKLFAIEGRQVGSLDPLGDRYAHITFSAALNSPLYQHINEVFTAAGIPWTEKTVCSETHPSDCRDGKSRAVNFTHDVVLANNTSSIARFEFSSMGWRRLKYGSQHFWLAPDASIDVSGLFDNDSHQSLTLSEPDSAALRKRIQIPNGTVFTSDGNLQDSTNSAFKSFTFLDDGRVIQFKSGDNW